MTCQYTEKISLLIDGELSGAEASILERHAADCLECLEARSDFLILRSQIAGFNPAVDRTASRQVLTELMANIHATNAQPVRSARSRGPFGALHLNPAFAAVAVVLVAGICFLSYRNIPRWLESLQPSSGEQLATGQKSKKATSSTTPASAPSPSPATPETKTEDRLKPNQGKRPRQKPRPPVDPPKLRTEPDDLISPWRNQAIAENTDAADVERILSVGSASLTARHLGQSELLLRSFRNIRPSGAGPGPEVDYERKRAQRLIYQNILLRREADARGDVQVATLLDSLEPILLDIANLPARPVDDDIRAIKERLQRKNLVALLQVNSSALARAND